MYTRRDLTKGLAGASLLACFDRRAGAVATRAVIDNELCGVTSGAPRPDGFLLWTRIPTPGRGDAATLDVRYEIATREDLAAGSIVDRGVVTTSRDQDFTVKARIEGLAPFTTYYYRFRTDSGYVSEVGRAKTAPRLDDARPLTLATVSCQAFSAGYYSAYLSLAQADVDFVLHLGDHMYERERGRPESPDPLDGRTAVSLDDFRRKYRFYLSDPAYREVRRRFTWVDIWDDHEVFNNWSSPDIDGDQTKFNAAFQAFLEYMPIEGELTREAGGRPGLQLYHSRSLGALVELFALDQRQYRDKMPCEKDFLVPACDAAMASDHTMLGVTQKAWFKNALGASRAKWRVLMSEVMLAPFYVPEPNARIREETDRVLNLDSWDGFPAERRELLEFIANERIRNVVAVTGDIHSAYDCLLHRDPADRASPTVATEVVGAAISSWPLAGSLRRPFGDDIDGLVRRHNPHIPWCDTASNGYTLLRFAPDAVSVKHVAAVTTERADPASRVVRSVQIPANRAEFVG